MSDPAGTWIWILPMMMVMAVDGYGCLQLMVATAWMAVVMALCAGDACYEWMLQYCS